MELLALLVNIAGAVAMLLWAVRMVRTGFERANGNLMRQAIRNTGDSTDATSDNESGEESRRGSVWGRIKAAGIGTMVAMVLQSSTAVAMLATGFAATGILSITYGMALLLGADLGSALVVQLLSLELHWLMPVLLLSGASLFLKGKSGTQRQIGRILIGVGLILLSLRLIGEATEPLRNSGFMLDIAGYLEQDLITAFLVGVIVTWILHSSVASILLIATLVAQSVIPVPVGLGLMLGSNLGSGLIAYGLTRDHDPVSRRIPLGNLLFRGLAAIAALIVLKAVTLPAALTALSGASLVVYAHVGFNLALLLVCLPFVGLMDKFLSRTASTTESSRHSLNSFQNRRSALDRTVLHIPQLALASATRECLRMSDIVESMLRPIMALYENTDKPLADNIGDLEKSVNRLHSEIKLFLAEVNDEVSTERDQSRKLELINFAINMEAVGDVVVKNLLKLASNKNREGLTFSTQGWNELKDLHKQVLANMQLALNVLVSGDLNSARQLVEEKDRMRDLERNSNVQHIQRLQTGQIDSIETSDLHVETLRALRQINSLFAAVAYPILSKSGNLLSSRLTQVNKR